MKKKWLISLVLILAMAFTFCLSGCGSSDSSDDTEATDDEEATVEETSTSEGKVYRTYMTNDVSTLNAHNNVDTNVQDVYDFVMSTLWLKVPDDDGMGFHWVGDLAEDLPEQIDEVTWEVTLREEACWENGEPITVDTLFYSWQMLINPDLVNSMANFFWYYIDILNGEAYFNGECDWEDVGLEKIDDRTFRIITDGEFDQDDVMLNFSDRSMYPVYEEAYEAGMNDSRTETSYGTTADDFVSCGPYNLESWTQDSVQVYQKNYDHWMSEYYHFDTIEVYIIKEDNAKMQMFESGDIDHYNPSSDTIDTYLDDPRLLTYGSTDIEHIDVNCKNSTNPISSSVNYRRALYYSINREEIAEKCFGYMKPAGYYVNTLAGSLSESQTAYRDTEYGIATTDLIESWGPSGYNVDLAREYLAAAYEECGVSEDTVITLQLVYNSTDGAWKKASEYLQEEWQDVFEGKIQLDIKNYSGISSSEYKEGNDDGWDLIPNDWSRSLSRYYPYTCFYYYLSTYDGAPNNYFSERFEEQYDVCDNTDDYEEQLAQTQILEEIYLEEVINIPVVEYTNYVLYSDRVQLPMQRYVPGFGYGADFADIVE